MRRVRAGLEGWMAGFANVTPKHLLAVGGIFALMLLIAGWNEPSAFMAQPRLAVVTGCSVQGFTVPGLLTQGAHVVMDVKLLETDRHSWIPASLGAAEGLNRDNYRYACPVGRRYEVWWDPRFPDQPYRQRWRMTPYVPFAFGLLLAVIVLRSLEPATKAREN